MSEEKQRDGRPRVGFIGAGLMGHGAARNTLEKGGYSLVVFSHRNPEPIRDLVARGARQAGSKTELVGVSDIVFLCLPSSDVVSTVVYGEDGLLACLRPGMIVVDTTTSLPEATHSIAIDLKKKGVSMVDAPLGRSPKEAEEGRLGSFVGGSPA